MPYHTFLLGLCAHVCSLSAANCFLNCRSTAVGNWESQEYGLHRVGCTGKRTEPQEGAAEVEGLPVVAQLHWCRDWLLKAPSYTCRIFAIRPNPQPYGYIRLFRPTGTYVPNCSGPTTITSPSYVPVSLVRWLCDQHFVIYISFEIFGPLDITQRRLVAPYRRFGTIYRSYTALYISPPSSNFFTHSFVSFILQVPTFSEPQSCFSPVCCTRAIWKYLNPARAANGMLTT